MHRAPALKFLLVTVFLDMLGLGLVVPIGPALMISLTGEAAGAARWSGIIDSSYGVLQFLTAPLLGRLADRYGRRPVLLLSLTCLGADWLAHALASTVGLLIAVHAVAGLCAGSTIVVNAYLADVTPPGERTAAYGKIGAAFGIGFVAGPVLGGLLGAVDVRLPFYAAAALTFAGVLYGSLVLPESRPGDRVTPLTFRAVNPLTALAHVLRRPVLGRLALARFGTDLARMTHQAIWTFFVTHQFGWSTARVGMTMSVGALAGAAFSARAVGPLVRRLGDKRAAVLGTSASAAALAGTAVTTAPWMIYPVQVLGVLGAAGAAAAQGWISRETGADEQGAVNGALTGGAAMAEAVVPMAAGFVFAWSLSYAMPGAVFAAAAMSAAAAALLLATTRPATTGSP